MKKNSKKPTLQQTAFSYSTKPTPQSSVTQQTAKMIPAGQHSAPAREPPDGIPPGYEESSIDLCGTWEQKESPLIHFSPYGVTLSDSGIDEGKASILIHCFAIDLVVVGVKAPGGNRILDRAEPGDAFGIWYSAGMKRVLSSCGLGVYMYQDGEKDVKKPKPMKVFRVFTDSRERKPLPILGDYRKKSVNAPTPLDEDEPVKPQSTPRHRTMKAEDFDPNEKQPF